MPIAAGELAYLIALLQEHTGVALGPDKAYLFESRLDTLCLQLGLRQVADFIQLLRQRDAAALETFIGVMTTHETFFYRDMATFEALERTVLPELCERHRSTPLKIWSAGCSTGQEPYSLAMLMDSQFPELSQRRVDFVATDIAASAVELARSGSYSHSEVNRGLPVTKLLRYFEQKERSWVIGEEIRSRVRFEQQNLLDPPASMQNFDLILCRNVLIYFDQKTKRRVLSMLRERLHPRGYLILGASERLFAVTDEFEPIPAGPVVHYRPRRASDSTQVSVK